MKLSIASAFYATLVLATWFTAPIRAAKVQLIDLINHNDHVLCLNQSTIIGPRVFVLLLNNIAIDSP
jgi:hypothetical protein